MNARLLERVMPDMHSLDKVVQMARHGLGYSHINTLPTHVSV